MPEPTVKGDQGQM